MRKSQMLAKALIKSEAIRLINALRDPGSLTVLAYHRIFDLDDPEFDFYRPSVSTSPTMFAFQMSYIAEHFSVIDMNRLRAFIQEGEPLPPHPLMITFDDGYLDNYTNAYPVLREYGLPATIFLTTGRMNNRTPLWWDECAYYFSHANETQATLPIIGECDLSTDCTRIDVAERFIRSLKTLPERQKLEVIKEVRHLLNAPPLPDDAVMFMSWEQVRDLVANGIACQPHTVSHPVLTCISHMEMRKEIIESRMHIEAQTGQPAIAFAYPNGLPDDYDDATLWALHELGFVMAFNYLPGPIHAGAVLRHPLAIRRVHVDYRDSLEIFMMKANGINPSQIKAALKAKPKFALK